MIGLRGATERQDIYIESQCTLQVFLDHIYGMAWCSWSKLKHNSCQVGICHWPNPEVKARDGELQIWIHWMPLWLLSAIGVRFVQPFFTTVIDMFFFFSRRFGKLTEFLFKNTNFSNPSCFFSVRFFKHNLQETTKNNHFETKNRKRLPSPDSLNNLSQAGMEQHGEAFATGEVKSKEPKAKRLWLRLWERRKD